MGEYDGCTQLIHGNGDLNVEGLESFVKKTKLLECGFSYSIVAVMGPQSSGKSTLLNHIFKTHFREMDAFEGRSQTTKGIWIAKCDGMEPFTIAMDLEGTDGKERGEDDTVFEKQTALFALTVANTVLINMWCHDIGREQASNKPLLKTVFQAMLRLFSPRKTSLLFVIRDKTKTPLEKLEPLLREDIQKIWDSVFKPETHKDSLFSEFFNVDIVLLSSYEDKEELFKQEVAELRQRICDSPSPAGAVPASGFSFSTQELWNTIKDNRDLDLPSHKVLVATVRCEEIAEQKLRNLATDESWAELKKALEDGPVYAFGAELGSICGKYFAEYDAEALHFDEAVRKEKFLQLKREVLEFVYPAYATMVRHVQSGALESYKIRLEQSLLSGDGFAKAVRDSQEHCLILYDKGCEAATPEQWTLDASKFRDKIFREMDAHTSFVQTVKLAELMANYETLIQGLSGPIESLLEDGGREMWAEIRKLIKGNTETAVSDFLNDVSGFELDHATTDGMVQSLQDYFQSFVEQKAREEAAKIFIRMKDRFSMVFNHDKDSMPRVWTAKEDIRAITKYAHSEVVGLLAVMAVIRLDERPDTIDSILSSSLTPLTSTSWEELNTLVKCAWEEVNSLAVIPGLHLHEGTVSGDPLASTSWEEVPPKDVLLTPVQCKSLWRQFVSETDYMVTEAILAQEAFKRKRNWFWLCSAIVVTGVIGSCCCISC